MSFFSGLLSALPGAVAQGLIWGLMAIGVFITFKVLDLADLTVDGTMATGGAVCIVMMTHGANVWVAMLCAFLAGMLAGLITGILHTCMGIPAILAGILTQLALFSINLRIMDKKANVAINPDNYKLLVSLRNVKKVTIENPIFVAAVFTIVVIALLYWFFGTALGCSIRATGANPNMSRAQGINVDFVKVLGLMLSNGLVALAKCAVLPVSGLRGCQRRPRRYRYRPCRCHHRRGAVQPYFPQLCDASARRIAWCGCVLSGYSGGPQPRPEHQRPEADLGFRRCNLPCCSVLEGQVFPRCSQERRKD